MVSGMAGGEGVEHMRLGSPYEEAVTLFWSKQEPQRQHRLMAENFRFEVHFRSWFISLL